MKQGFTSGLGSVMLALLVAVALVAAGWGHRVPGVADRAAAADLAAYLATGGSIADLCETPAGTLAVSDDCPVCRMPGAPPLPAREGPATALRVTVLAAEVVGDMPPPAARHPAWQGRAPPVV